MKTGPMTAAALLLVLAIAGCGGSKPVAPPAKVPAETAATDPGDTPEAAIRRVTQGLEENRPQVLWEGLPPSYQNDVNRLVRSAAARVDPEIWGRSVAIAQRTVALLRTKRDFVLQNPALHGAALSGEEIVANYDGLVGLLETVVQSDLARLDRLERFDGRAFLETTGAKLLRQLSELMEQEGAEALPAALKKRFQGMKVTEVKRDGDSAVLRIDTGDPEVPAQEHEYVRVEGKWLPRAVADGWAEGIKSVGGRLEALFGAEAAAKSRKATLAMLARIEKTLEELEAAEDAEQFQAMLNERVILPMMVAAGGRPAGEPAGPETPAAPGTAPSTPDSPSATTKPDSDGRVLVIVRAALDEKGRDEWQEKLAAATDKPSIGLALPTGDGAATRFEVTPVADVQAFAKRIKLGVVKSVDDAARTVSVDP